MEAAYCLLDRGEIERLIPHREPFLFIQKVTACGESEIRSQMVISGREDFFRGHYPGHPVMPGVLLLECVFQTAAIFIAHTMPKDVNQPGKVPMVTRVQDVKFRSPVRPGDVIEPWAKLTGTTGPAYYFDGGISRLGKTVASASFACMLAEAGPA